MLTKEQRESVKLDSLIYMCYDYILPISVDRVLATHGSSISLITYDGNIICTYDSIYIPTYPEGEEYNEKEGVYEEVSKFIDDILVYVDNGLKGIMDYDGNIVLEAKYRCISFNSDMEIEVLP